MKHLVPFVLFLAVASACGGNNAASSSLPTATPTPRFRVAGVAMWPTLKEGDVVEALPYGTTLPQRADIIVFRNPINQRPLVKRIVGLPGESITIDKSTGDVSVNGQRIEEPYVQYTFGCSNPCAWTVPATASPGVDGPNGMGRYYFVLGDNRPNSADSRHGWLVPAENIFGYVTID